MDLEIDVGSAEPVYEQIVRQVRDGVQHGKLAPGLPLPSIRQLAHDLDLNHNTVAKAYKILEGEHVILTAGQKGTFINENAPSHIDSRNRQDAAYLMTTLLTKLVAKGLSTAQMEATFQAALSTLVQGPAMDRPANNAKENDV